MIRYSIIANGRVQGVGFRFFCKMNAINLNLTGFARNLYNGDVEIEVQGEKENIDIFISKIREGNRFINVSNLTISKINLIESEKGFATK